MQIIDTWNELCKMENNFFVKTKLFVLEEKYRTQKIVHAKYYT